MPLPFLLPFAATQVTRYLAMQGAKKIASKAVNYAAKNANKTITGAFYVDAVNEASKGNTDPLNMMTVAGVPGAGKVLSKIPKVGKYLESAYNKTTGGFSGTGTILKARQSYSVDKDMGFATPKTANKTYIFGDNLAGYGKGGQAAIRNQSGAYGIPSKVSPSKYMTDANYSSNIKSINDAIKKIPTDKPIVISKGGIGTGLAKLKEKAPQTYNYLQSALKKSGLHPEKLGSNVTAVDKFKITGDTKKPIQTYLPKSVKVNKKRNRSIYEGGKRNKEFVDPNPLQAPTFKKFKKGGVAVRNEIEQGIKVYYDKQGLLASKYLNPKQGMGTTNKYLKLQEGVSRKDFKQRNLNEAYKTKKIMEQDQNILQVNVKYDKTTAEAFGEKRAIINSVRGNMAKLETKGTPLTDAYIGSDRSSRLIGEVIKRTDPKVKINMGTTNKQAVEKASQTHGPRGSKGVIQTDIPKKGLYTAETYAKASQTDAALKWIRAGKFKGGQHVSIGNRQVSTLDTYTAQIKQANTPSKDFTKQELYEMTARLPSNIAAASKKGVNKAQKAKEALELRNQEALKRKNMLGTGLSSKELADKFSKEKFDTITRNEKGTIISIISKPQEVGNLVTKEGVTKSVSDHVRGYLRNKFKTPKSQKKNIANRIIVGKLKKYDNVGAMIVLNKKSTTAKDMANLKELGQDEFRLLMGSTRKWSKQAFRKFITGIRNERSRVGNIKLFPDSLK